MRTESATIQAILEELNEQQRAAVCHEGGPLLIVAGAGTGKTMTLVHRVAYLLATGGDPDRTLLLTFSRRAAAEMLRRVDALFSRLAASRASSAGKNRRSAARRVWGGTFHAIANRLLRQYGKLIGLERDFTILDRGDAEDLLNVLRGQLNLDKAATRFPLKRTCLDIYSRCVNKQLPLEDVLESDFPWCLEHAEPLKTLFDKYVDRKEAQTVLDYDDLLLFWRAMMTNERSGDVIRDKFDTVLVDEYQDTNILQAEILEQLCPEGSGLTVVGDDAQSIYSFRAATVRNILDFPKKYLGTKIVTLEQNYRSRQPILEAANAVFRHAVERHAKNLWTARKDGPPPGLVYCEDEDEQTDFLIEQILEHRESGTELKQQAVLFRASHHSVGLELELAQRNIPFHKYGGLRFIETAHVKDLMAYLKLAENPRDLVAGLRTLMLLPGIGQKKAHQLMEQLAETGGGFAAWNEYKPPQAAAAYWPGFVALMQRLAGGSTKKNNLPADIHLVRTYYAPLLEQKHDHPEARLRDLEQLEVIAGRFADRATFLAEVTLDPPSSTQELPADPLLDEDYLVLSTIHSAKGLEWDAVYVIHAADGQIPSDMSTGSTEEIEEERRLFYVALTRARNWLYVCFPERYYFHNRGRTDFHSYARLTRFLPQDVRKQFAERLALPEIAAEEKGDPAGDLSTSSIRRQVKQTWSATKEKK